MDNKQLTLKEIASAFNIHVGTVISYLKKASKHNWCDYSPKYIDRTSKKVLVYKENSYIAKYNSPSELSKRSIDDFGINFDIKSISSVALGKSKSYKGYIFKYVA